MMGLLMMELGTAAGRKEAWSARAKRQAGAAQRRAGAVSLVGDAGEEQRRAVEVSGCDRDDGGARRDCRPREDEGNWGGQTNLPGWR